MKLTESQLRKIIREELKAVRADQLHLTEMFDTSSAGEGKDPGSLGEVDDSDERETMRKIRMAGVALDNALSDVVAKNNKRLTSLQIKSMIRNLKNGPKRGTYYDELNLVRDGKPAAEAAKELLPLIQVTMDEEKLEPGLDVIANLFKDYRAKYGVNFDRFLFYVRQMLKKEGIDAKQLANREDMKATIKSIAHDAGKMLRAAMKQGRLPLRR